VITVRFPNGQAVTYNDACFLRHGEDLWTLFTADPAKGGKTVALIQTGAGVLVEFVKPCSVVNGLTSTDNLDALAERLIRNLRNVPTSRLKRLKLALREFNAKTWRWR
jgi:hypothetical protein